MVYKASKLIEKAFKDNDIKCRINETKSTSAVEAGFTGDNVKGMIIRFISTDDDNDVAVRVYELIHVPEAKKKAVTDAINKLHCEYRYVKFHIDDDDDLTVSYDFPLRTSDPGSVAVEMFVRITRIVDDAYPVLMRAIWA